mgnify:CR=1 FL=1
MIEIKDLLDGEIYHGKSVETIARRLYGQNAKVRKEHQSAFEPVYAIYTVTKTDRYGTHVLTRFYTTDFEMPKVKTKAERI